MARAVPAPAGPEDVRAITAIVERWTQAFAAGDAGLFADDYADDADYLNAFGRACRGGPAIAAFLQEVFRRGAFAGRPGPRRRRRSASCARTWPWSTTSASPAASGRRGGPSTPSGGPTTSGS